MHVFPNPVTYTPGFGEPHKVKLITQQIEEFFSIKGPHGIIDHVDGIRFVVQANFPRLIVTQNYNYFL